MITFFFFFLIVLANWNPGEREIDESDRIGFDMAASILIPINLNLA